MDNHSAEPPVLELPSCPAYVIEGESLNCTCRLMNNPKPSPLLWWDSPDHREVGPVFLSKDKVNRDQNGKSHSCHAKWSNETVSKSFTLNVACTLDECFNCWCVCLVN